MGLLDEVVKEVTKTADATKRGAEKLSNNAKCRYRLLNLRSRQSALFEQLGRLSYAETENGEDNTEERKDTVEQIRENMEEIAQAEEELAKLQNVLVCPCCGEKIKSDNEFCPKCGQKLH